MRNAIIVTAAAALTGCATTPGRPPAYAEAASVEVDRVYYFIDGRTASREAVMRLPRDSILRIQILRGPAAAEWYGAEAGGAMLVSSTRSVTPETVPAGADPSENLFYFIDGETATRDEVRSFPRDSIERILILKGAAAMARYGPDAERGAVVVSTRRAR